LLDGLAGDIGGVCRQIKDLLQNGLLLRVGRRQRAFDPGA
jgi:hypothetical protein